MSKARSRPHNCQRPELRLPCRSCYLQLVGRKPLPRELIDTGSDKRFVRRDSQGRFKESDDVGRSLAQDQKRESKTKPRRGEGDRGDR